MLTPEDKYHIILGLHSKIPKCCIRFWLSYSSWMKEQRATYRKELDTVQGSVDRNHVPCPECVDKRVFVRDLHWCTKEECSPFIRKLWKKTGILYGDYNEWINDKYVRPVYNFDGSSFVVVAVPVNDDGNEK